MTPRKIAHYGWRRGSLDHRDIAEALPTPSQIRALPSSFDLHTDPNYSQWMPPVVDQLALGACVANAVAGAVDFERARQGKSFMTPSRLYVYYLGRVIENSVKDDAGLEVRDGIKVVAQSGVCPESEWPYDISKFAVRPPAHDYTDALLHKALNYRTVNQKLWAIKYVVAGKKRPVVFGFNVYNDFESAEVATTGIVPDPMPGDQPIGGHCTNLVGFDDGTQRFIARNSWGDSWGQAGYCTLSYNYLLDPNQASDFWVITLEE